MVQYWISPNLCWHFTAYFKKQLLHWAPHLVQFHQMLFTSDKKYSILALNCWFSRLQIKNAICKQSRFYFALQILLISKTQTWFALLLRRHRSHLKWIFLIRMFRCAPAVLPITHALLVVSMHFRYYNLPREQLVNWGHFHCSYKNIMASRCWP